VALILEVKGGRLAGKKIDVPDGGKVTIGRAPDRAQFAVPHDSFMSSVHFSVECGAEGSRVKDRKSSNGTYLNGAKISEAALAEGDEIRSGRTVFVVRIAAAKTAAKPERAVTPTQAAKPAAPAAPVAPTAPPVVEKVAPPVVEPVAPAPKPAKPAPAEPSPARPPQAAPPQAAPPPTTAKPAAPPAPEKQPPAKPAAPRPVAAAAPAGPALVTIKSWQFAKVPEGWEAQGEFGIQRAEQDVFPSNLVATEEMLGLTTLQRFIEAQVAMLRQYLREPRIEASLPPTVPGAEETVALDIRYSTKDEQVILLRRIFARSGKHVGVLTVTTLEKDLEAIRPALDTILAGVSFQPQEE
jgi:pSer/pThr/pTyr-binding forkhead associated (FHA) protein